MIGIKCGTIPVPQRLFKGGDPASSNLTVLFGRLVVAVGGGGSLGDVELASLMSRDDAARPRSGGTTGIQLANLMRDRMVCLVDKVELREWLATEG